MLLLPCALAGRGLHTFCLEHLSGAGLVRKLSRPCRPPHRGVLRGGAQRACRTRCRRVLDIVAEDERPRMLSMLINRELRRRKGWIGERTDRHGGDAGPTFDLVGDSGAAVRAEAVSRSVAA